MAIAHAFFTMHAVDLWWQLQSVQRERAKETASNNTIYLHPPRDAAFPKSTDWFSAFFWSNRPLALAKPAQAAIQTIAN
jgi:hypothetical protein